MFRSTSQQSTLPHLSSLWLTLLHPASLYLILSLPHSFLLTLTHLTKLFFLYHTLTHPAPPHLTHFTSSCLTKSPYLALVHPTLLLFTLPHYGPSYLTLPHSTLIRLTLLYPTLSCSVLRLLFLSYPLSFPHLSPLSTLPFYPPSLTSSFFSTSSSSLSFYSPSLSPASSASSVTSSPFRAPRPSPIDQQRDSFQR